MKNEALEIAETESEQKKHFCFYVNASYAAL